jgi:hypothetical protein
LATTFEYIQEDDKNKESTFAYNRSSQNI